MDANNSNSNKVFLLGNMSYVMAEIRDELCERGYCVNDCDISHTGKMMAFYYEKEITQALALGQDIYLIQVEDDMRLGNKVHVIEDTAEKSVLLQVLEIINVEPKWWYQLLDAYTIGGLRALENIGATKQEAFNVQTAINGGNEKMPDEQRLLVFGEKKGGLHIYRTSASNIVVDLFQDKNGFWDRFLKYAKELDVCENILVLSPGTTDFFGSEEICNMLGECPECYELGWASCPDGIRHWSHTDCRKDEILPGWERRQKTFEDFLVNYFAKK